MGARRLHLLEACQKERIFFRLPTTQEPFDKCKPRKASHWFIWGLVKKRRLVIRYQQHIGAGAFLFPPAKLGLLAEGGVAMDHCDSVSYLIILIQCNVSSWVISGSGQRLDMHRGNL